MWIFAKELAVGSTVFSWLFFKEINCDRLFRIPEDCKPDLLYWTLHRKINVSIPCFVFSTQIRNHKPICSLFVNFFTNICFFVQITHSSVNFIHVFSSQKPKKNWCHTFGVFCFICLHTLKPISKVGDLSRRWPENSLFNSYYTDVLERALLLPQDCATLPLILDPHLIMPGAKQGSIEFYF